MKSSTSLLPSIGVAIALSLAGGLIFRSFYWLWWNGSVALLATTTLVGHLYCFFLLWSSGDRLGLVTLPTLYLLISGGLFFAPWSFLLSVLIQVAVLGVIRVLVLRSSFIVAGADMGISVLGITIGLWTWSISGSLVMTLWTYFLSQSLIFLLPQSNSLTARDPASSLWGKSMTEELERSKKFEHCHLVADRAIQSLLNDYGKPQSFRRL